MVLPRERTVEDRHATAVELTDLLQMPICFERAGRVTRCLELRFDWSRDNTVRALLAYRTDSDRQGENGDVRTWPKWQDPQAPALLRGSWRGLPPRLSSTQQMG